EEGEEARHEEHDRDARDERDEVQEDVAKIDRDERPAIRAEEPEARREVIAELPQKVDRTERGRVVAMRPDRIEAFGRMTVRSAADPRRVPASGVPAARHGRQVVEPIEQLEGGESLEHADVEGRAPDSAARKGQTHELRAVRTLENAGAVPSRRFVVRIPNAPHLVDDVELFGEGERERSRPLERIADPSADV